MSNNENTAAAASANHSYYMSPVLGCNLFYNEYSFHWFKRQIHPLPLTPFPREPMKTLFCDGFGLLIDAFSSVDQWFRLFVKEPPRNYNVSHSRLITGEVVFIHPAVLSRRAAGRSE